MTIEIFEVGGCIRDELMGQHTKDVDFTVIAPSFDAMRQHLVAEGFKIHVETEQFHTIRAGVPKGHPLRERTKDADFVWARKEGPSSDGRHPDWVEPGTLHDDLARRDFTMNAVARDVNGDLIDPFGGIVDIERRELNFVGDPMERIHEDGLRVMRGFRFMVTKGVSPSRPTFDALHSREAASMLRRVSKERIKDELDKMFMFDPCHAVTIVGNLSPLHKQAIFSGPNGPLRMMATLKSRL